ncbi:ATP-binding protein [uncultured Sphaerochaeta sp.]|uniref:ATP-binding protein n=1 Tax=uncultured Sphaerochaeta sp. TaxID=886478 RepID=UPI002A0A6097|nr:ATP-binding protein [uncultured Sphaerochaeta sp.]
MLENELDLDIHHTGYRLSHFQLFNWGTFSDYIVNLDLAGENTLLTGANGSGKTTLVDGLLTLLVPREYRAYNLSGGQDGKEGRSEESYVLGAYSTTKSEHDYSVNKEYLRDKSCHSIILGQFDNANTEYPLTLLQIRYFNQNGVLQRYFILCEGALDLQAMTERDVAFDATPGWKKRMQAAFSSYKLFFFDTFKAYSIEFASRVGFRDREKALRIFSQTVGMKDLSNLNEFIRTRMLSEMDIESEFKKTLVNFETLMGTKNSLKKKKNRFCNSGQLNRKRTNSSNSIPSWSV